MNDDQNGLSLEDDKISKINSALQKQGKQEFKGALSNVGMEIMPQATDIATTIQSSTQPEENVSPIIQSLRTYERDVAESIRAGQTAMSINLAEQKRRLERNHGDAVLTEQSVGEKVARGSLFFIMSTILVAAALGTLVVTFYFKNRTAPITTVELGTIISVDDSKEVVLASLSEESIEEVLQKIMQENGSSGVLTQINLKKEKTLTTFAEAEPVEAEEFFKFFAKSAPSALGRALGENWLLGFYSLPKVDPFINEPFVIFELESFDSAYNAMLEWETKMLVDIGQTFKTNSPGAIAFSDASNIAARDQFEDLIVRSRDTRVLRNTGGKILILYSFIDTGHLVIATHEETFREIVARYLGRGLVR